MTVPESELLTDVRAMFASLYNAERLRQLPLVRKLAAAGHDLAAPDLADTVRRSIDRALESLDSRARAIVVRCDLGNETHLAVASDLGIGERYFYRERRRALLELADAFTKAPHRAQPHTESQPLDAIVAAAAALRSAGRPQEGVALLVAAHGSESSTRLQVALALRLAHFAVDCGDFAEAAKWTALGRRDLASVTDSPAESAVARCELDLVEIRGDVAAARFEPAQSRARSVARRLTALTGHRQSERIGSALADAYVYLSEAQIMRGSYADGLALALEGHASLQRTSVFAQASNVDVLLTVAYARFFATASLARIAEDLGTAYSRAVALGLGRDVTKIAAALALICALRNERERSAAFARTASLFGSQTLASNDWVNMMLDLIAAAISRGDALAARALAIEAKPHAEGLLRDVLSIAEAEIELLMGDAPRALEMAQRAADRIGTNGNRRFLGSAHRVEAEALTAIGRHAESAHRISDALDCLKNAGHPITLARAYAASARITGSRRHDVSARELLANAQAV